MTPDMMTILQLPWRRRLMIGLPTIFLYLCLIALMPKLGHVLVSILGSFKNSSSVMGFFLSTLALIGFFIITLIPFSISFLWLGAVLWKMELTDHTLRLRVLFRWREILLDTIQSVTVEEFPTVRGMNPRQVAITLKNGETLRTGHQITPIAGLIQDEIENRLRHRTF